MFFFELILSFSAQTHKSGKERSANRAKVANYIFNGREISSISETTQNQFVPICNLGENSR